MNYKDWLIPELKSLNARRESLTNIPLKIKTLELSYASIKSSRTDATPVSGGTNQREEAMIANIAERDKLRENLRITRQNVARMDKALAQLTPIERTLIERFYINRERACVDRLTVELGYERAQVYRLKEQALIKLARLLFGVVEL